MNRFPLHSMGVYAILDIGTIAPEGVVEAGCALYESGVRIFQVRGKTCGAACLLTQTRLLRNTLARDALVIVNDRADVALAASADGVHVGQEDLDVAAVRRILGPSAIVGLSTHTMDDVRQAQGKPCDYIGFGPLFSSITKRTDRHCHGPKGLAEALGASSLPVVAIGGIGIEDLPAIRKTGASGAAMIGALLHGKDILGQGRAAVAAWDQGELHGR